MRLDTQKVHAKDCEICESDANARVDIIDREIVLRGDLAPAQVSRLSDIAERCPVYRTLVSETIIRTAVALEE